MSFGPATWQYAGSDPSITLFDRAVTMWGLDLPPGARVLELGCCETDFHSWLLKADPTIQLTGMDVNPCPGYSGTFIKEPAESWHFDDNSFEAVILLGSLEHFGLGFYGDPVNDLADAQTLWNICRWLVPGGWCYYDVPWTPQQFYITENRHFRVYDDAKLRALDHGYLRPVSRMYAHGETDAYQPIRPTQPTTPFWYVQRLVEKPA